MADIEDLFECEEDVKGPRFFWFICLSPFWLWWILQKANGVFTDKLAEAEKSWARIFSVLPNWATPACWWVFIMLAGLCGLVLVFAVAHCIGWLQASITRPIKQARQNIQNKRDQVEFEAKMQDMDRQSGEQAAQRKFDQSKKELIKKLGSVAQYIVVLEIETDSSKRAMALQSAQSRMMELSANIASGQIAPEAIESPEVRAHAMETSVDLKRLGLAENRLNREIVRIFKLGA